MCIPNHSLGRLCRLVASYMYIVWFLIVLLALVACGGASQSSSSSSESVSPEPTVAVDPTVAAEEPMVAAEPQNTPPPNAGEGSPPLFMSTAFNEGETIPTRYTCDGEDVSPPLQWSAMPSGTQSFALIVDDPDAPIGIWVHWVLFDIPGDAEGLAEAANSGTVGANSWGDNAYGGPCPPPKDGAHRYFFKLYALDVEELGLAPGASKEELEVAMQGHVLAEIQLMGTYERQ